MTDPTRAEVCAVACAEAWRGDGAILAGPMGLIPRLGARLAQLTFAPELVLSDGEATLVHGDEVEGWLPYRAVFAVVATSRDAARRSSLCHSMGCLPDCGETRVGS